MHHRLGARRRAGRVTDQGQTVGVHDRRVVSGSGRQPTDLACGIECEQRHVDRVRRRFEGGQHRFAGDDDRWPGVAKRVLELGSRRGRVHRHERRPRPPDRERRRQVRHRVLGYHYDARRGAELKRRQTRGNPCDTRLEIAVRKGNGRVDQRHRAGRRTRPLGQACLERRRHQAASARLNITTHCPSWQISPCWFRTDTSKVTIPRSPLLVGRVAATVWWTWIVSPIRTAALRYHVMPRNAIAVPSLIPSRDSSPVAIANTPGPWKILPPNCVFLANSSSVWSGLKSPERPAKSDTSASVIVRAGLSHDCPISNSSKYIPPGRAVDDTWAPPVARGRRDPDVIDTDVVTWTSSRSADVTSPQVATTPR